MKVLRKGYYRIFFCMLFVGALASQAADAASATGVSNALKPVSGGNLVEALNPGGTYDPASPSLPGTTASLLPVFGGLYDAIGKTFVPDEATGFTYTNKYKTLTITLHKNMVFQDGTPFNSEAVKYNLVRDSAATSTVSQDLNLVKSITCPNARTVVIHFSQPDANFMDILPLTGLDLIGSPTAEAAEGSNFGLHPVGAGPWKLQSFTPNVSATFVTWAGYFGAKTRYLNSVEELNASTSTQAELEDLLSGSVQTMSVTSAQIAPSSLSQAETSPNVTVVKGPEAYDFLPLNGTSAPFDNIEAREALDYCINRPLFVSALMGTFGAPQYTLSTPTEAYAPNAANSKSMMPFQYNPTKGKAIVQSLGGISFTLTVQNQAQQEVVASGLAQMLAANCGIKVTVNPQTIAVTHQDLATGNYQAEYTTNGSGSYPGYGVELYAATDGGYNTFGVHDAKLNRLLTETQNNPSPAFQKNIWGEIFLRINQLAMDIPFAESPNYVISSRCLHGDTPFLSLAWETHAWLSC